MPIDIALKQAKNLHAHKIVKRNISEKQAKYQANIKQKQGAKIAPRKIYTQLVVF